MSARHDIPLAVLAFASRVPQLGPLPPRPCAWRELSGEWVIVFEDGRKLRFMKAADKPSEHRFAKQIASLGNPAAPQKKGRKK